MNTILEAIKDMDPATIKNIGVAGAMAIGALVLVVSVVKAMFSIAIKAIKAIAGLVKGVACCAVVLVIGAAFTNNPEAMEKVEDVKEVVIEHIK